MSDASDVYQQNPNNPDFDIVHTKEGPMHRKDADAKAASKPVEPKTGVARMNELKAMLNRKEINDSQYNIMAANALEPDGPQRKVPTTAEANREAQEVADLNEVYAANDSFADLAESILESAAAGRKVNPDSLRDLQDRMLRTRMIAERQGYDVQNDPHFINMQAVFERARSESRYSNALKNMGG